MLLTEVIPAGAGSKVTSPVARNNPEGESTGSSLHLPTTRSDNADVNKQSYDRSQAVAISVVLWSVARMGTPAPGWWLDAAFERIERLASRGHVRPREASMALWALGKCGLRPSGPGTNQMMPGLVSSALNGLSEGATPIRSGQLGPPEMVALLDGLTSVRLVPTQVWFP